MRRRGQRVDVARQAPAGAPDLTGRRIAFLPAAVLGNGSLLVTLSGRGELEGLFWPSVDGEQHLGTLRLGVGQRDTGAVHWLDDAPFRDWQQRWEDDTGVLHTVVRHGDVTVEVADAVDPAEPVLVRRVRSGDALRLVVSCHPELDDAARHGAAYVDPATGAVVFYRRRVALAIALDGDGETAPRGAVVSLSGAELETERAFDVLVHRAPFEGSVEIAFEREARVIVAFGESPDEALALVRRTLASPADAVEDARRLHDTLVVSSSAPEDDYRAVEGLDRVYRRSLLVLETLTDRATGAVIAAPEMDPDFERSGGYGFVWPRDLAYVALGLLAAGSDDAAAAALRWLARHRAPEGLWLQRYWCDGALAPSWGLHQVDETGAALFAFEAAWHEREDERLDAELWVAARDAGTFLTGFVDPETELLRASVDLWEQADGQHTYSCAACIGGLRAAAAMAERHEPALALRFHEAAARLASAVDRHLWSDDHGHYVRSLNVARVDDHGVPPGSAFDRPLPYPNRHVRTVDPVDARLDSSLLGLGWPFAVVDPAGERMRATAAAVAAALGSPDGGLRRQVDDEYAGGNVWLIASLWHGLYARLAGDDDTHRRALAFTVTRATALDLLPEQVLEDGTPAWVLPLAWSHAMLVLASRPELALVRDAARGAGVSAS